MELHTVGVNGGYTQQDVTELAKVFTGWTIENQNTSRVRAVFDENKHEGGTKIVMEHPDQEQRREGRHADAAPARHRSAYGALRLPGSSPYAS